MECYLVLDGLKRFTTLGSIVEWTLHNTGAVIVSLLLTDDHNVLCAILANLITQINITYRTFYDCLITIDILSIVIVM